MLADIDDPPRSRTRGMLIGIAFALPVAALFIFWLIPSLVGIVLGGAANFDEQARQQDAYMKAVCEQAMQLPRDESLCECALAVDYPALDCQGPFRLWAVEQQQPRCADPQVHRSSLSYCTCVETVAEAVEAADTVEAKQAAAAPYDRCIGLKDGFSLPTLEELAATPSGT